MSAKRSAAQRLVKKYGEMAQNYQDKIDRQAAIIDRLVRANQVYSTTNYLITQHVPTIKEARKLAKETQEQVDGILAVPTTEGEQQ